MICNDCRGNKCLNLIHEDKSASQECPFCVDGIIANHGECIKRNEDKVPADCDCQHNSNARRKC